MQKEFIIPISDCDNTGQISIPHIFSLFMDLASEHGDLMGLGFDVLGAKDLYWLTVRTKIQIHERPKMLKKVTLDTWPAVPGRVRCDRYYTISDEGRILVEGKTEWAIINMATGRLTKLSEVYPPEYEYVDNCVCEGAFARMKEDFSGCEEIGQYTIRSTDIDVGQHMNNAAYIHAVFGAFSCEERAAMDIRQVEAAFKAQCYEGDTLSIRRRYTEDGFEIGVVRSGDEAAVVLHFVCG